MGIVKGDSVYTGVKEKGDQMVCEKCGGEYFSLACHADARDFFSSTYNCTDCSNVVTVTTKRSPESRAYWD